MSGNFGGGRLLTGLLCMCGSCPPYFPRPAWSSAASRRGVREGLPPVVCIPAPMRGACCLQVLLGALKLAVPALQGPCAAEGGRPRLLRALEIAKTLASLKVRSAN
jgi:hypothetical protein